MKKAPASTKTTEAFGEQLSFLPPPPFCPTWPTKGTLPDRALALFMEGRVLTTPDFQEVTKSWRLGATIHSLRDMGWPIDGITIPSPTEITPGRLITLYRLAGKYIALASATGRAV